jgi:hypothetical protein
LSFIKHITSIVIDKEGPVTNHAIVFPVGHEYKRVVGEVFRFDVRITLDDDISLTPAPLPGTYNQFSQTSTVIVATSAGEKEERGKRKEERGKRIVEKGKINEKTLFLSDN